MRENYSSMLGKNSLDLEDDLPDLTDVSGRMAQMTKFVS